jgi:hypothetical protein
MANPHFGWLAVALAVGILVGLFQVQRWGTGRIGALFGAMMLLWFAAIAVVGAPWIVRNPRVLWALSPHHAVLFFIHNGFHGFVLCAPPRNASPPDPIEEAGLPRFDRRALTHARTFSSYSRRPRPSDSA